MDRWNVSIEASNDREELPPVHKVLKVSLTLPIKIHLNVHVFVSENYLSGYTFGECSARHRTLAENSCRKICDKSK